MTPRREDTETFNLKNLFNTETIGHTKAIRCGKILQLVHQPIIAFRSRSLLSSSSFADWLVSLLLLLFLPQRTTTERAVHRKHHPIVVMSSSAAVTATAAASTGTRTLDVTLKLPQLQNLCKRDPVGYREDYDAQCRRLTAELQVRQLQQHGSSSSSNGGG